MEITAVASRGMAFRIFPPLNEINRMSVFSITAYKNSHRTLLAFARLRIISKPE